VNNHVLTETNRLFGGKYMKKIANHQTFAKISSIETLQELVFLTQKSRKSQKRFCL